MPLQPQQRRRTIESHVGSSRDNEITMPGPVITPEMDSRAGSGLNAIVQQIANAVVGGNGNALPAQGGAAYTPDNMPIDPMQAMGGNVPIPTPAPTQMQSGDAPVDIHAVDPASAPITTDDVMNSTGGVNGDGYESLTKAAAMTGAALATYLGLKKLQGNGGDRNVANDNARVIQDAVDSGTITPEQAQTVDPNTGDAADAKSGGTSKGTGTAKVTGNSAEPTPSGTAQRTPLPDAPAVESVAERGSGPTAEQAATPAQPTEPVVNRADPDTAAIGTEDIVPQRPTMQSRMDPGVFPEGTTFMDTNPLNLGGSFIQAGNSSDELVPPGSIINTKTKEMFVPLASGEWAVLPPGLSHENIRRRTLAPIAQALRALR